MNIDTFFSHWNLSENPFVAEEARDDLVYQRIMALGVAHPDFEKLFGNPGKPSTAVVFGEKGSGKTAIRLLMEDRLKEYNNSHPDKQSWIVHYDEFNHFVDRVAGGSSPKSFAKVRTEDHMDKIMSLVVTDLVDILTSPKGDEKNIEIIKKVRSMPRQQRLDLASLVFLYDQPSLSTPTDRWHKLGRVLRVKKLFRPVFSLWTALIGLLLSAAAFWAIFGMELRELWVWAVAVLGALVAMVGFFKGFSQIFANGRRSRNIRKEVRCVDHPPAMLRQVLGSLRQSDLSSLPIPAPGDEDSRYELQGRLIRVLESLDYASVTVLIDRVDEPTRINGDAKKMKGLIWPIFHHKFLQQDRFGVKMLLPIELGYELRREEAEFFSRARLDKSNLIDKLEWSGTTLFDICTARLKSVYTGEGDAPVLCDLFEDDVEPKLIIEALDQMRQPRDAFKFFYDLLIQHCLHSTESEPQFKIPKLVLEQTRRKQSQRVADLARGYSAA
ncbi:MAG: hypothetical protein Q7R22_014790 [Verrucomicrobiota bacterium JB025]|nr:hypothetical protein [Verrucomicrobiota bacterium JB025]